MGVEGVNLNYCTVRRGDHQIRLGHESSIGIPEKIDTKYSRESKDQTHNKQDQTVPPGATPQGHHGQHQSDKNETHGKPTLSYELKQVQDKLSSHFGSRVLIHNESGNKGNIKIPYLSHEDLNRIIEILDL